MKGVYSNQNYNTMKVWKISNNCNENVKIVCKTASNHSKGIILEPNQFCISECQITSTIDAQERRGFIKVDREFDNAELQLEYVKAYTEDEVMQIQESMRPKSDFERAAENAEKYINDTSNG